MINNLFDIISTIRIESMTISKIQLNPQNQSTIQLMQEYIILGQQIKNNYRLSLFDHKNQKKTKGCSINITKLNKQIETTFSFVKSGSIKLSQILIHNTNQDQIVLAEQSCSSQNQSEIQISKENERLQILDSSDNLNQSKDINIYKISESKQKFELSDLNDKHDLKTQDTETEQCEIIVFTEQTCRSQNQSEIQISKENERLQILDSSDNLNQSKDINIYKISESKQKLEVSDLNDKCDLKMQDTERVQRQIIQSTQNLEDQDGEKQDKTPQIQNLNNEDDSKTQDTKKEPYQMTSSLRVSCTSKQDEIQNNFFNKCDTNKIVHAIINEDQNTKNDIYQLNFTQKHQSIFVNTNDIFNAQCGQSCSDFYQQIQLIQDVNSNQECSEYSYNDYHQDDLHYRTSCQKEKSIGHISHDMQNAYEGKTPSIKKDKQQQLQLAETYQYEIKSKLNNITNTNENQNYYLSVPLNISSNSSENSDNSEESLDIIYPVNKNECLIQEKNQSAIIQKQGELFYLKKKIPKATNLFKGFSEIQQKKVVAVILNKDSQEFMQLICNTIYINSTYFNIFFSGHLYSLNYQAIYSIFLQSEIYEGFNKQTTVYSIQQKYQGSLEDFIKERKKMQKPLSTQELEQIFIRILYIGAALETLSLYHSNLKASKILINYDKNGDFQLDSIVLSSLQNIFYINPHKQYIALSDANQFLINFNGYNTPEVLSFQTSLIANKQNSYAIGLIMINLISLEVFSATRFTISFKKGMMMLENDEIKDNLRNGILLLLREDQKARLNCVSTIEFIFGINILPLKQQFISFSTHQTPSQDFPDLSHTNQEQIITY